MTHVIQKLQHSLQVKLILPILLSAVVVVGLSTVYMFRVSKHNTELAGLTAASALAEQVVLQRAFYTNEVVSRAKQSGLRIDHDYAMRNDTLPFPATLVKALGKEIEKRHPGTSIRLYSEFPFPYRATTETYDAFEKEALTVLKQTPKTPFYRLEDVNGRLSMRYAMADIMGESCVACHNAHPESPKTNWKVGDVRGVLEIIVPVETTAAGLRASTLTLAGFSGGTLLLLVGGVAFLLRRVVLRPVRALAATNERVRAGDYTARVEVLTEDELGVVATSFNRMADETFTLFQNQEQERENLQTSVLKLLEDVSVVAEGDLTVEAKVSADATGAIADSFNHMIHELRRVVSHVQEVSSQVSSAANEIQSTAEHLAQGSTTQASQIVDSSTALSEMATSIQQVAENATLCAAVADQALANARQGALAVQNTIEAMHHMRDEVETTATRIQSLGERSQQIGEIVQLIGDIADRTSVLALNASIEASLAGEVGQGFAVVAHEVERLAESAFGATRQIAGLIKAIQEETQQVVKAMAQSSSEVARGSQIADQAGQALQEIETVSTRLADLIQAISMASTQQARGSEDLSRSMGEISLVTQETATGTKQAAVSIGSLATLADELRSSVRTFKLPTVMNGRK
jgi:methyl-accepting chemotaxis protein